MSPRPGKIRYAVVVGGWISQEMLLAGTRHTGTSTVTTLVTGGPEKAKGLGGRGGRA